MDSLRSTDPKPEQRGSTRSELEREMQRQVLRFWRWGESQLRAAEGVNLSHSRTSLRLLGCHIGLVPPLQRLVEGLAEGTDERTHLKDST